MTASTRGARYGFAEQQAGWGVVLMALATLEAGVGLMVGSWMVVPIAVAGALAWNLVMRPVEEADLPTRFGEPYRQYAGHVRCWIPTRR